MKLNMLAFKLAPHNSWGFNNTLSTYILQLLWIIFIQIQFIIKVVTFYSLQNRGMYKIVFCKTEGRIK